MDSKPKKSVWKRTLWIIFWIFIALVLIGYFFGDNSSTNNSSSTSANNPAPTSSQGQTYLQTPSQNDQTNTSQTIQSQSNTLSDYQKGAFTRDFKWDYKGYSYETTITLYPEVDKVFKARERVRDYDLFASDIYSKPFIKSITENLRDYGKNSGLSDSEIPYFIISFVQSLPYTSDKVTTGFDEYPRFPYETIYDDGGDCEDTSILVSSMLNELGYGVAMLEFKGNPVGHMAVGIKCTPSAGQSYYAYGGMDFCYLETTSKGWDVGQIPDEFKNSQAIILPIVEKPSLEIHFISNYAYNYRDVYTNVNVTVKNLGSETAKNTKIYVALQTVDQTKVWSDVTSDSLEIDPEGAYQYTVTNLHSPTGQQFRIYVRAYGDNVISGESYSDWIYWK